MPYLSKIALNPRRRSALALLPNPHRLHAAVLGGRAAGDLPKGEGGGRVEDRDRVGRADGAPQGLGLRPLTPARFAGRLPTRSAASGGKAVLDVTGP